MESATQQFVPPKELRILSVVQILFMHPQSNNHTVCKVELSRLNKKLQKLQREGMFIVGVFVTDVDKELANAMKHAQKGGVEHG